jgi:hypothetical protein
MIELDATQLHNGEWVVRPKGQLGTMGWHPFPWTAVIVKANNEQKAIAKALPQFEYQSRPR